MNGPRGGRDRGHRPIDFPFFGLAGWTGPTWAEFYEGGLGEPVTTLWLGHRVPDGRAHLSVGTHNQRPDSYPLGADLAFGCLFTLTERMRPDRSAVTLPAGFNTAQIDWVQARSQEWQDWATVPCTVDGAGHALSYQRYAWGWAGFVVDAGTAGIKLVGVGLEPAAVRLETVREPARYGFDPAQWLFVSDLQDRRERDPDARLPLPWATTLHADQRALVERHGPG